MIHASMALFGKLPDEPNSEAIFLGTWTTDIRHHVGDYIGLSDMPNFPDEGSSAWVVAYVGFRLSPFAAEAHMDLILHPESRRSEEAIAHLREIRTDAADDEEEKRFIV